MHEIPFLSKRHFLIQGKIFDLWNICRIYQIFYFICSVIDNNPFNVATGTGCGGKYLAVQVFHSVVGDGGTGTTKEAARTCSELGYAADPSSSKPNASAPTNGATETCSKSIIYVLIPSNSPSANYSTTLNFPTSVSSDLDFVTVVSTDSVV